MAKFSDGLLDLKIFDLRIIAFAHNSIDYPQKDMAYEIAFESSRQYKLKQQTA